MKIDTTYLKRCTDALEKAHQGFLKYDESDIEYEIFRSATVKEFEIILEQVGKLMKKVLKPYFHSSKAVDNLYFKDVFRHAGHHGLLTLEEVERWLQYRDNRNNTAHDYGVGFANKTLVMMPSFINDTKNIIAVIENENTKQA